MDCVFVGPWSIWFAWLVDMFFGVRCLGSACARTWFTICVIVSTTSKNVRSWWTTQTVTVAEYVKSWLKDIVRWWNKPKYKFKFNQRNRSNSSRSNRRFRKHKPYRGNYCLTAATLGTSKRYSKFDTDSKPIRIDNCASYCISNDMSDFIHPPKAIQKRIKGLAGSLGNLKQGTIRWKIEDDQGKTHVFDIPNSLYVKESPSRLLSPQHWSQVAGDGNGTWCATYNDRVQLQWNNRTYTKTVPLDRESSNVATLYTVPGFKAYQSFVAELQESDEQLMTYDSQLITDDEKSESEEQPTSWEDNGEDDIQKFTNFNLDDHVTKEAPVTIIEDEEDRPMENHAAEFLKIHHQLGHVSPKVIRIMAKRGLLPSKLKDTTVPLCTSCMFGKATKRPWRSKPRKDQHVSKIKTVTRPGECVSVDQLESSTPGLIAQMKGFLTKKRYTVATIFVDHFSGMSFVYLQKSTKGKETLEAKKIFELFAKHLGVTVQAYHADNGRFAEELFIQDANQHGQIMSYCGVNAHFQNGLAERKIRSLQDQARTMLLHANRRWPGVITAHLWPYALRMANDIQNVTPQASRKDGLTPIEIFSNSAIAPNFKHFKPFGCPAYVLQEALQAGNKHSKWRERARLGAYLGHSPKHSRTVALILNLETGHVSPQFHVKCDSKFETVRKSLGNVNHEPKWERLCGFVKVDTKEPGKSNRFSTIQQPKNREFEGESLIPEHEVLPQEGATIATDDNQQVDESRSPPSELIEPINPPNSSEGVRRSSRANRGISAYDREQVWMSHLAKCEELDSEFVSYETVATWEVLDEELHPLMAFAASTDPDTMYYHEAMREPDKRQFLEAMQKEVQSHTDNGVWELMPMSQVPQGAQVLPSVWAMKRKRRIATREVYKWKARLNIDGSKQTKGLNYWETFSPVASWTAIRIVLILTILNEWKTKQIDFVLAYTQADVECELYMQIPKGFEVQCDVDQKYVLKLKKNLFGQKQAGRVWNEHLVGKLKSIGFVQSDIDECLFYKGTAVFVLYTDDSILAGPNEDELNQIVEEMSRSGLNLTIEGELSDFLGVKIERLSNGNFKMSQPHLIQDILRELRLNGTNVAKKTTPGASSVPLLRHSTSEDFDGHFDYRKVIGKLNYLEKCTRPDISCAVHQCARFVATPKVEHGKAVKWIGRYLAGTSDEGIILSPNSEKDLEVYVDASFAGNWDVEDSSWDMDTARSRTGYVILYAACPVLWTSKLQGEIALSTTESEYLAISAATREVLPIVEMIKEMIGQGRIVSDKATVFCRVFEDNSGAIEVATNVKNPKMRPRTKHINTKYHHFRSKVMDGTLQIEHVPTQDMVADILTKCVNENILIKLRKVISGW